MTRYILFGADATGHNDYVVTSNDLVEIRLEAHARLSLGWSASIVDNTTNDQTDLSLKPKETK